jgi:hypothetical protein
MVNANSQGIHLIHIQQSYGFGVEAVQESFGHRFGTPVQLAVR